MGKETGTRKNIVLTLAALQRLEFIKKGADLSTDAEAVRETLKLYEKLMRAQLEGAQVRIEYQNGSTEVIPDLYEAYVAPEAIKRLDSLRQEKENARAAMCSVA